MNEKLQNYVKAHHSVNDLPLLARSSGIPLRRFRAIIDGEIMPSSDEKALISHVLEVEPERIF